MVRAAGTGGTAADERRRLSTRAWRIFAGIAAGVLILAALVVTTLRIAIAYLPDHADRLRSWVERQTHMRIEYAALDARLRWYGPEVVLRNVRVLDEEGTQAMFVAREASVGLNLWNFFRTGQFVAGRVRLEGPRVTIVRLADGRVRLLGQAERPADRPPFDLDRLPAGRLEVADVTVVYRDLKTGRPPLELRDLRGELRRDRDYVVMEGSATLPQEFDSRAEFDVRLKGSLDEREHLDARVELRADTLRLAPLADFIPAYLARPERGRGSIVTVIRVTQGQLTDARARLDLQDVALRLPARQVPPVEAVSITEARVEAATTESMPSPTVTQRMIERPATQLPGEARFPVIRGQASLRREGAGWAFRLEDFRTAAAGASAGAGASISGTWWGRPVSRFGLQAEAKDVDLGALWPLAVAFAPPSFDHWAGAGPRGRVASLHVTAQRPRAGAVPTFEVAADLRSIGVNPMGRWPGIAGLTATVDGSDQRGLIKLRASSPEFDLPRLFVGPIQLASATADVTWRREAEAWIIGTRGARLAHAGAQASVDAQLQLGRGGASPVLTANATIGDFDVSIVPQFIPVGRLRERTIAWLDRAFVRGTGSNGRFSYRGPLRKFPFRQGEGEFRASVDLAGLTLDYYPGFAPLTEASGHAEFRNESIEARLARGQVGGVRLADATFRLADYKYPVLEIAARGDGDLQKALAFVQASPLGPRIGAQFMGLRGNGAARYDVSLFLPVGSEHAPSEPGRAVERDYFVRATLQNANVALPALRAPAQRVNGVFELHNEAISIPSLRGTILDGPFELKAGPGKPARDVLSAIDMTARGRAGGSKLPAFIGLPAAIRMTGATDWELRGRIEKRGTGNWPMQFDVTSNLAGLDIAAPRPFAKAPAEVRPTRVRIEIPGRPYNDITIDSGSARAKLRFGTSSGQWRLDRGTARFDGQPVGLGSQPGLLVTGDWPQFDLAEWLALGDTAPAPARAGAGEPSLMDWLGPVDVHLDRATVFGFELADVVARLRGEGDKWRVGVTSANAEGQVTIPAELARGQPIVLDMKRLHLVSANESSPAAAAESPTDPRKIPAIRAHADDFAWEGRRFGQLDATISRDSRGLTFESLQTRASHFAIDAKGSWYVEPGGPRTRLDLELNSTDFGATAADLGYRDAIDAKRAHLKAQLWWPGGPSGKVLDTLNGTLRLSLRDGQVLDIEPGAGRVLGLLSVTQLPRRLALDFSDVTRKGLAFNSVEGDFELRNGNAYTQNLLLKGPAVNIGIAGRTGLGAEDYDQTVAVSGNTGGPLAVAGALAAGPVVGAGVLVLSQLFKNQLQQLARVYYHVTGPWSAPVVERIPTPAEAGTAATAPAGTETPKDRSP